MVEQLERPKSAHSNPHAPCRMQLGNLGYCEAVGEGVSEMKIDLGPGYRVYYGVIGRTIVLLLCGGDKKTQDKDIRRALEFFRDHKQREKENA